jgi:hypothetical protein
VQNLSRAFSIVEDFFSHRLYGDFQRVSIVLTINWEMSQYESFLSSSRPFLALPFILNPRTGQPAPNHDAISPHDVEQSPAPGENQETEAKRWLGLIFSAAGR